MSIYSESVKLHKKIQGKIEIKSKVSVNNKKDLSLAYTPGVAEVCKEIAKSPSKAYDYTIKGNTIAIVTDGSSVLGLGNIGAEAALPVMEGKALLFKEFVGINAFPLCFKNQNPQEIINAVKNIAPVFGGINLEDIKAPECFQIEAALQDIGIPVFHDDQHGTAVVILAGLINAAKVVGKRLEDMKIVVNGAGAAGISVTRLLDCVGYDKRICTSVKDIIVLDSKGIIHKRRKDLNKYKIDVSLHTNKKGKQGGLAEALEDADVFIGVSTGNVLTPKLIKKMSSDPIVFAMSNPHPEIMPGLALKAGAAVVGTGRSDFPNQINNLLAFPGIFLGALQARASVINNEMKLAAAYALSGCISPTRDKIIPDPFNMDVPKKIAAAVKKAAKT